MSSRIFFEEKQSRGEGGNWEVNYLSWTEAKWKGGLGWKIRRSSCVDMLYGCVILACGVVFISRLKSYTGTKEVNRFTTCFTTPFVRIQPHAQGVGHAIDADMPNNLSDENFRILLKFSPNSSSFLYLIFSCHSMPCRISLKMFWYMCWSWGAQQCRCKETQQLQLHWSFVV